MDNTNKKNINTNRKPNNNKITNYNKQNINTNIKNTSKLEGLSKIRQYIIDNYKKIILGVILVILLIIGIYLLIKWYKANKTEYTGYSYYGQDLSKCNNHLFELQTLSFDECKEHCLKTPNCKGITLNPTDEKCYGTGEGGILRYEPENTELKVWIKPEDSIFQAQSDLLLTMTDKPHRISNVALLQPFTPGRYNYNFYIFIDQFKSEAWKHVFHKGSEIETLVDDDWDNIVREIPEQFIGVWIAPYNTYMRIAITTKSGQIEYVDIENIPINKLTFVSVSLLDNTVEVYINTKLVKTHIMKSPGMFNNGHIYTKYDNSFKGSLYYLTYTPEYLNHSQIVDLYRKSLPEIKNETIKKYSYKSGN